MSAERLVNKLISLLSGLDVGVSVSGLKVRPLATINRGLSSIGAGRIEDLKDIQSVRRAIAFVEGIS